MIRLILLSVFSLVSISIAAQNSYQIGVLKYSGGGDWYSNPTSVPNLVNYFNEEFEANINLEVAEVDPGSPEILNYPFIHMTGHGNVVFSEREIENLRAYLLGGGFIHIDDNYGMDQFIRPQIQKIFPELELTELSFSHPVYHQAFEFPNGLPKVHKHDEKPPQGFGIIYEGRLVLFYTYESDLGDGWEDEEVHNDSAETREKAFKMGANILQYALLGGK